MFTGGAYKEYGNELQRGLRGDDLFISIIGKGAFGFLMNRDEKSAGYIAEKLNLGISSTTRKLAELINGVIEELLK